MTVEEIYEMLEKRGISAVTFWDYAMGGDRADLPREDVERVIEELLLRGKGGA